MAVLSNSTPAPIERPAGSLEAVLTETLHIIERLLAQARARIAAHDAWERSTPALAAPESTAAQPCKANGLAPKVVLASTAWAASVSTLLPSLTSAFATRRAVFGAFDGEDVDG